MEWITEPWITIIANLFSGFVPVIIAGIFLWKYQASQAERLRRNNIYFDRRSKEEDEFYNRIRLAKEGYYRLCVELTNDHGDNGISQITVNQIVSNLQSSVDMAKYNKTVLSQYQGIIDNLIIEYNNFSNTWGNGCRGGLKKENAEYKEYNSELMESKEKIFQYFDEIDELYFTGVKSPCEKRKEKVRQPTGGRGPSQHRGAEH